MKKPPKPTIEQLKKELHDLTVNRTNEKRREELQKYIDHFNYGIK